MRNLMLALVVLAFCPLASARIGETERECNTRYGTPKKVEDILPGCRTNEYNYHAFKIRIAFRGFNEPAIMMIFQKQSSPHLKDDEVAAILSANTPNGTAWKATLAEDERDKNADPISRLATVLVTNTMGGKAWQRSDGATAELLVQKMGLTLRSREAIVIEAMAKQEAETRRKAAVPTF